MLDASAEEAQNVLTVLDKLEQERVDDSPPAAALTRPFL